MAFDSDAPEADAYRILRTRIMHRCDLSYSNTLMVTSALPGEGKTLTAINLALTFAKQFNQTVLLVDCDLRRQMVHEVLSYKSDKGLVNYLIDDEPMSELIVWPGIEKLTIVSGGRAIKDSSELLGSPAMKGLIDEMKHRYPDRLVIFDAPPILAGADTLAFAPLVDSILVVVRAEHTSGKDVERAVGLLPQEKIIGTVFNRGKARQNSRYAASYGMSGENS